MHIRTDFCVCVQTILGGAAALELPETNAILAETGITTVPPSVITGPIAVSPIGAAAMTGWSQTLDSSGQFSTSSQVTGDLFAADYTNPTPPILTIAIADMVAAYSDATGRTSPNFINNATGLIGGLTLTPGLYKWTTAVSIGSDITISGAAADTWIFQVTGTLTVANGVRMTLSGGAVAANIVWGVFLGKTGITLKTGSTANGRLLAQTLVALDSATVTA
ncbi:ice-binding protein [Mycena olivaceomarginata]|nr:ice-binding protein [Mycena olivaceomarginata]